jgi:hypothetical protein
MEVPNVAAELLALVLRVWHVPGWKVGPKTGYPAKRVFVDFLGPSTQLPGSVLT